MRQPDPISLADGRGLTREPARGADYTRQRRRSRGAGDDDRVVPGLGDRAGGGAHRALPGLADRAGADGLDLSAGGGGGGALAGCEPRPEGQGARGRPQEADLGPEREIADRLPAGSHHDEREARLDPEARRHLPGAAEGRDGRGAAAARQGEGGGEPRIQRAADRDGGAGAGGQQHHHHHPGRAREPAGRLRPHLQPDGGLRLLALSRLPALLLLPAGLHDRSLHALLRHGHGRRRRALGRLQLG